MRDAHGCTSSSSSALCGLRLDFDILKMFVKFTFTCCNKNMNSPASSTVAHTSCRCIIIMYNIFNSTGNYQRWPCSFISAYMRFCQCDLISAYPYETALKTACCMRIMQISEFTEKKNMCGYAIYI